MPLTPLHYSIAYLINKLRTELSLPALVVSSMAPDLESPFIFLLTGNLQRRLSVLHSLLGASTIGTLLSILLTVFVYPSLVSPLFRLDRNVVKGRCRFSGKLVASCFIGCVSHVIMDSLHHDYNPLLYPFLNESFDELILLNNLGYANFIVFSVFLGLSFLILIQEMRRGTEGFWKRILVA